jgi:hypothetical protein
MERSISFADELSSFDPQKMIALAYSYMLHPSNFRKSAMIEFATLLAACHCRGNKQPSKNDTAHLMRRIGSLFRECGTEEYKNLLDFGFVIQGLFVGQQGDLDQVIELTWKRFESHDSFLEKKLGFNVANAIFFAKSLLSSILAKMSNTKGPKPVMLTKEQEYDFSYFVDPDDQLVEAWEKAIQFSEDELVRLVPQHLAQRFKCYLRGVTIDLVELPRISNPLESNPLFEKPIIKFRNKYVIPVPAYVLGYLSLRLHRELLADTEYRGKYISLKGRVLEESAHEKLRMIFSFGQVFRNIRYRDSGKKVEADIIVAFRDCLIFVECTTRWITGASRRGNPIAIRRDLDKSIRKCYLQARRARQAYQNGHLRLKLKNRPAKFLTIVVTDTLFPNLLLDMSDGTYVKGLVQDHDYPYIVSIFDLEFIAEMLDADKFIEFVLERIDLYEHPHIICTDESDYVKLFLKPEYKKIKQALISGYHTLSYIGPEVVTQRQVLSNPLHIILDAIGSDGFMLLEFRGGYSKEMVENAMGLLYLVYDDWDKVLPHMVFDAKGFNVVVQSYRQQGKKCRAIAWEGMNEYLKHAVSDEAKQFSQKLRDGSIREDVNILIPFETDLQYPDVVF